MRRVAYCPNCGWEKENAGLKEATKHNQICYAQREGYRPEIPKQQEIEEKQFQWYQGWEKQWERVEKKEWEDA